MRKETRTVVVTCDACWEVADAVASVGDLDICEECYRKLHLEARRVFDGEVPTRRGGFRQLGEMDT